MRETAEVEKNTQQVTRPPVVVVVGHIDHGKTTLLDYVRSTKVAERESGGITQAIGAYQAEHHGKKITFIDTPGHEAFSAMRSRGAHVADIAILVVAADEGVKPQTEEGIKIIQNQELPFAVAITKTDKPNADPNRVKQELAERNVLVEGYGGTVPAVALSAKTGEGVDQLLETVLLLAELEELSAVPAEVGEGVVIESHLDSKRGNAATLLVENGTVRRGEFIAIGDQVAPVRIFENFLGQPIDTAGPAEPVRIVGFAHIPSLGERFVTAARREDAERALLAAGAAPPAAGGPPSPVGPRTVVNIILTADVLGSQEAIEAALTGLKSEELGSRILKRGVGDVTETDVKLAAASKSTFIAAFRVKVPPQVRELALRSGVTIVSADIIYELIDGMKSAMLAIAPAEVRRVDLGQAKILALFKEDRGKQIVGGRVEQGLIRKGARFDLTRNRMTIGAGRIIQLQASRQDVEEVGEGQEFGILAESDPSLAVGDGLSVFTEEKVSPTF